MDRLRCVVERITYQNAENGYSVLRLRAKGYNDLITAVGNMADTHVGSVLTLQGQWKVDAKYGRQFSIESYEETLPATGWVRNEWDGSVTMEIQGEEEDIDRVILSIERGTYVHIENMDSRTIPVEPGECGFRTR